MIVKMEFVSITGRKNKIDTVTNEYLSKYEIQLENTLSEMKTVDNLVPFDEINPYKTPLSQANQVLSAIDATDSPGTDKLSLQDCYEVVKTSHELYAGYSDKGKALLDKIDHITELTNQISSFRPMQLDIQNVLRYRFVKFRFGRIPLEHYNTFKEYTLTHSEAIYIEGGEDSNYFYLVYFTARGNSEKWDAIYKSLHFERIFLSDSFSGTPEEAYRSLEDQKADLSQQLEELKNNFIDKISKYTAKLLSARDRLQNLMQNFEVRKLAACVHDKHEDYFILCGWMARTDVVRLLDDVKDDPDIFVIEDSEEDFYSNPPTKLKNPGIFKPFELLIRMYGYPCQTELDPTIFVAITYTFIFGFMFGDVGQGLVLFVLGMFLYKIKKSDLGGIIAGAGVFSTFFGFMFGSFFGFENVISPKWLRPLENMTTLPFVGSMNTVFVVSIVFGMGITILTMVFHIINAIHSRETTECLFDPSGVSGLVFYTSVVTVLILYMTGHVISGSAVLIIMFGIPLALIAMKEPLTNIVKKRQKKIEESVGMFAIQVFFELFETLLAYFSNTISFVRIGAFAISHGAMMGVVLMLAGAEKGDINWAGIIVGNIIVCGFEGLIVFIQVLRLEYYEMFSRFYKGTGREFKPFGR